jgi:hypothetical protein
MASTKTGKKGGAAVVAGSQADYDHFLKEALALPASQTIPLRADLSLAQVNVNAAMASLLDREAEAKKLPGLHLATLKQLPRKMAAAIFAATQVSEASTGEIAAKLARASVLRKKMFRGADALAEENLFPADKVKDLHKGTGKIDVASDCVGLAALFTKFAKQAKGKTTVTAAEVKEAAALGSELLKMLKPTSARRGRNGEAQKAADIRDRMWTLVVHGHADVWRACAFLYGPDRIDEKAPPLLSRAATTSNRKKANAKKRAEKEAAAKAKADGAKDKPAGG